MNVRYIDKTHFTKTNYTYPNHISPKCNYEKHRGLKCGRIRYWLPNGIVCHYGRLPKDLDDNEKKKNKYIIEFEAALRAGYFPINDFSKLSQYNARKSNKITLYEAISLYYGKFNAGKWYKTEKTIKNEKPTLTYLIKYFIAKGTKHITDITTQDLKDFNREIETYQAHNKNKTIAKSTQKSYKKLLKAFLNCMNNEFDLDINISKLDLNIYTGGKIDNDAYARTVHIPSDLLDKVDYCSHKSPSFIPDQKELIHFLRKTGLCKAELATLSNHNLAPNILNFDRISIFDKPDCPTTNGIGFTVKTKNRNREIPLDERCVKFIKAQLEKLNAKKVYGKILHENKNIQYIEYHFLFPHFRDSKWQRCDTFLKSIQLLLKKTSIEFDLGYEKERYTIHDFRNTLNGELGEAGVPTETRAYILGHSKEVNEKNYMNFEKLKEIQRKKAFSSLSFTEKKDIFDIININRYRKFKNF